MDNVGDTISMENVPQIGLKDTIKNLEVLVSGADGSKCPRCGQSEFWKGGTIKTTKGEILPRRICCNCGYTFSFVDIKQDSISKHRAARIFNLNDKKVDMFINDAIEFGVIKKEGELYSLTGVIKPGEMNNLNLYRNVPIYNYLIKSLGATPRRSDFEKSLKQFLGDDYISKIKRDVLWRRYQEIASDIFICGKLCKFSRTCKKNHIERKDCDVVRKAKDRKKEWRVDIQL